MGGAASGQGETSKGADINFYLIPKRTRNKICMTCY